MLVVGGTVWALVAIAASPYAWGWDDWTDSPRFDPYILMVVLLWPVFVPVEIAMFVIAEVATALVDAIDAEQVRRARAAGRVSWL